MLAALLATLLLAQNPATCSGADPVITTVAVQGTTPSGDLNVYHLKGTVTNLGQAKQASNVLQFVDIYYEGKKVDSRGVPPLAVGQSYAFAYDFKRSTEARDNTSHFRFVLDFKQPAAPGVQDCATTNDAFRLTF